MIELGAAVLEVRDQGDRGTCVGFATAAAHEAMQAGGEQLSPEDAMWAAHELMGRATAEETSAELALFGLEAERHATEVAWPYGNPHWSSGRPEEAGKGSNLRKLPGWTRLGDVKLATIRAEIAAGRAVILTLGVVKPVWLAAEKLVDTPAGAAVRGNHAVAVVGASEEDEPMQGVRIKNSWGEQWADGGYALISERYLEAYGVCAHSLARKP